MRLTDPGRPGRSSPTAMASFGGSLGYPTLIILVAALPALALGGVAGAFAKPLVLSYALAVVASLMVAFTVTPALALLLLGKESTAARSRGLTPVVGRVYDRWIGGHVQRPRRAYAAVGHSSPLRDGRAAAAHVASDAARTSGPGPARALAGRPRHVDHRDVADHGGGHPGIARCARRTRRRVTRRTRDHV